MCDFHSVIITRDGRIFHRPSNSHTGIANFYELANLPDQPQQYWECEWDGIGDMPANLVQDRNVGYGERANDAPDLVWRTAERHYTKLAAVLRGELPPDTEPFNQAEYSDVPRQIELVKAEAERRERERIERENAARLQAEQEARNAEARELADKILAQFASETDSMDAGELGAFVRQIADELSRDIEDVFPDELEEATDNAADTAREEGEEAGYDRGYEAAGDELYSADYVAENISDFIDRDEWCRIDDISDHIGDEYIHRDELATDDSVVELVEAAYRRGFAAAIKGATPEVAYVNGLPSFLFDKIADMVGDESAS